MSNTSIVPWGRKSSPEPKKQRKNPDYSGKVGPSIETHEQLKALFEAKKAVFIFGKPLPVAVVYNLQYGYICKCLKNGYIKEYNAKGFAK